MRQEPDHRGIRKQDKLFGLHPVGKGEPWKLFEKDCKQDQSGTLERKIAFLNVMIMVPYFFSASVSFLVALFSCFLVFNTGLCTQKVLGNFAA